MKNGKSKKGFTLIELIAVLIILAILALIVTPLVLNVVRKAKDSANKRSIDAYGKSIEQAMISQLLDSGDIKSDRYYSKKDTEGKKVYDNQGDIIFNVDYKGNTVYCDIIDQNSDGSIYITDCYIDGKKIDYSYGKQVVNTLMEQKQTVYPDRYNFFSTTVDRRYISNLTIVNEIDIPEGYSSSDCSKEQNGSVMCWWIQNGDYYDMYIGANGIVYAPENSSYLFEQLGTKNMKILDLGNYFDTSKVTNMYYMFNATGLEQLTHIDFGSNFDTSNVINMRGMFFDFAMDELQTLELGDKFDTSNVTDMSYMFCQMAYYSTDFEGLDLGDKFNTSNVIDMRTMFSNTAYGGGGGYGTKMTKLDLGDKFDTSKVTNMDSMFSGLGGNTFKTLALGNKFDTSKVTNMSNMFSGMSGLQKLDLGNKFNTSKVTNMHSMFSGMSGLQKLDLGNKFNTLNVTNMDAMFFNTGYNSMTELNLGNFGVNRSSDLSNRDMFTNCGYKMLNKVIVKNNDVKNWLNGLSSSNVPDYFKNKIQVSI